LSPRHRIVISGGGTGGHIYPALAVAQQLKANPDVEAILYIGAKGHLEERLAAERNVSFVGLRSQGLPRRLSPALLTWPFKMLSAVQDAQRELRQFQPTVVLGTGGYASAPPLAAALLMGIPYAIHEPDAHPGLVNKLFARGAALCSLGMEEARSRLTTKGDIIVNGNPVSDKFLTAPGRQQARTGFGLKPDLETVLVTGGSQGAQAINDTVWKALPMLMSIDPKLQILHQVGEKNFEQYERLKLLSSTDRGYSDRYIVRSYIEEMGEAYAAADLTVCRAGAMTIADLTASATPAIFIPYPFAAQDHQSSNARYIESKGGALVIAQKSLSPDGLYKAVRDLLGNPKRLEKMRSSMRELGRPHAAREIAEQLQNLSSKHQFRRTQG
jgi:UDP-N-acetylglucosamine--N-acetylmuramyl-(pentapeptide) pyrophosphoryl-undecaprenol N-acetylglucosamine transferase